MEIKANIDRWAIIAILAIFIVAAHDLILGLGIVALVLASWLVTTIERLQSLVLPVLFARTILSLYAFGWIVESYTSLSPWLSIPIGLIIVVVAAGATSDPLYGIRKEED